MTDEELTKALHAAAADHYSNMTLCQLLNAAADRVGKLLKQQSSVDIVKAAQMQRDFLQIRAACFALGDENEPTSLAHLHMMLCRVVEGPVTGHKAHRWLGYVQGVLIEQGLMTLDEAKAFNKKATRTAKEAEPIMYPRLLQEYSRDGEIIQLIQETEHTHVVTLHTGDDINGQGTTGALPLDAAQDKYTELVTKLDREIEDG